MKRFFAITLFSLVGSFAYAQQVEQEVDAPALQKQIEALTRQVSNLERKLSRSNVKILETTIEKQNYSIDSLRLLVVNRDSIIAANNDASTLMANQRYYEGRQSVFAILGQTYQQMSFDKLIKVSTKISVERDVNILSDYYPYIIPILNDLQKYYSAQQILEGRCDEQLVANAIEKLDSVQQKSDMFDRLRTSLEDYQICNDGLKGTIESISEIDRKTTGNNDEIQKLKRQEILGELSSFLWNYQFNFNDYPYLTDVILEIMKRKQKDADAPIDDLLRKL